MKHVLPAGHMNFQAYRGGENSSVDRVMARAERARMEPQAEGGQRGDTRAGQGGVRKPGEGDFSRKGSPLDPRRRLSGGPDPHPLSLYPRLKLNPIAGSRQLCGP